jgi:hypothetical protein
MRTPDIDTQYTPQEMKEKTQPRGEATQRGDEGKGPLEGIALRRVIGIEAKNRIQRSVQIEAELIQALGPRSDINFDVNLALELYLTKYKGARVAVQIRND